MDFKTFAAQHFNGDAEKAQQHLVNESNSGDYSITGSRENLKTILDTMTREEAQEYMRFLRATIEKDKVSAKGEDETASKWLLVFPVFFLVLAIWMFITGCRNILQINELNKTGVQVQVTVTNKDVKDEGENLVSYYTFTYELDGNIYSFVDSPDREYDIGETFTTQLDPNNPEVLVLPSANLAIAFMLLLFSGATVFFYQKAGFLAKYIPHALTGWAALMVVTGVLLPNTTSCVLGCIFLAAIVGIWVLVWKRKAAAT